MCIYPFLDYFQVWDRYIFLNSSPFLWSQIIPKDYPWLHKISLFYHISAVWFGSSGLVPLIPFEVVGWSEVNGTVARCGLTLDTWPLMQSDARTTILWAPHLGLPGCGADGNTPPQTRTPRPPRDQGCWSKALDPAMETMALCTKEMKVTPWTDKETVGQWIRLRPAHLRDGERQSVATLVLLLSVSLQPLTSPSLSSVSTVARLWRDRRCGQMHLVIDGELSRWGTAGG